ncbi:MAG: hypothetical protein JW828_11315 [Sedimentisphaerales bacterium]|nr:hypothetical protein [Sedimentisphaerales bacterium]
MVQNPTLAYENLEEESTYGRFVMEPTQLKQREFPTLMTEEELIDFLRIPEVSKATDHHNVIEHLKRFRTLPRIHICNSVLYPKEAILKWIDAQTKNGE